MSNIITLPKWMTSVKKLYNTVTGGDYQPHDVALAFALTFRLHGTADALRQTARNLVDNVCRQHKPNMKRLYNEPDDAKVWDAAEKIVNRVTDMMGVCKGEPFPHWIFEEPPVPEADEEEILRVLEEIANEVSNPKKICEEVMFIAEQLPEHQRAGLFIIAGSNNPRAIIMSTLRRVRKEAE